MIISRLFDSGIAAKCSCVTTPLVRSVKKKKISNSRCVRTTNPNPRPDPIFGEAQKAKRHCRLTFFGYTRNAEVGGSTISFQAGGRRLVRRRHHRCGGARQALLSPIGFVDCLPATRKTTNADRDNCMALVVDDPRLEQDDRRRLLKVDPARTVTDFASKVALAESRSVKSCPNFN